MYFNNDDYSIFTSANKINKTTEMMKKRKYLQNKLLTLHNSIYPEIQQLGLGCHDSKRNITTRIEPDRHTGEINTWLLVRYGKTSNELVPYQEIGMGFTKHADIQFGISEDKGFSIELFLGRKDGFDRGRIKKTIERHRNDIQKALMELKGYSMTWEISGNIFNIDDNSSDFCDWLLKFDKEGDESFLSMTYGKTDERISEENICTEIISKVKLILPLYNILTWRK